MRLLIVVLCLTFTFIHASAHAEYREVRNLSISATSLSQFLVDAGAGDLTVTGSVTARTIMVGAEIVVLGLSDIRAQEYIEKEVTVELFREGNKGKLNSIVGRKNSSWIGRKLTGSASVNIHLSVTVPHKIALNLRDTSGDLSLENLNQSVNINDEDGDIILESLIGSVDIRDKDGHIRMQNVDGRVNVEDESGDVRLENNSGDLFIKDDSGDIEIKEHKGAIEITDDKGEIEIDNSNGPVIITDDSGDIDIHHIDGAVSIKDDAGNIRARDIKGNISVDDKSGDINISKVAGTVTVDYDSGNLELDEISKDVVIVRRGTGTLRIGTVKGTVKMR